MNQVITRQANPLASATPVALARASAKARHGDLTALQWLIDQHEAGNALATRTLEELGRVQDDKEVQKFVA